MPDVMKIYNHFPVTVQNAACTLKGMSVRHKRYSPYFMKKWKQFQKTGTYSYEQVKEYQDKKLKKLLIHSYETVPYYKKEFDDYGFNPYRFQHADEMAVLPILTKDVLKEHIQEFLSSARLSSKTFIHLTGGTTGKALTYYTTLHEQEIQWAVWWRYRNGLGIRMGDWCAEFGSKAVVPPEWKKAPYWRFDYAEHRKFFSPYHLNADTVRNYAEGLCGVKWVHGYTSKLADMAYWLVQNGIVIPMEHITAGAENLYDTQKKLIEQAFGNRVYQHYGLTEGAANFSQKRDGRLRVDEDFCYVEFVNSGREQAVVGTPLHYYRMPLIRYAAGDYARLSENQDGGFRIVEALHGRDSEYIVTNRGTKITAVEFDEEIFAKVGHAAEAQVVQKSRDELEIRVIRMDGYTGADEEMLMRRLNEIVGRGMKYTVSYPEELERAENGKFKMVVRNDI